MSGITGPETTPVVYFGEVCRRFLAREIGLEAAVDLLEPPWARLPQSRGTLRKTENWSQARTERARQLWREALRSADREQLKLKGAEAELGVAVKQLAEANGARDQLAALLQDTQHELAKSDLLIDGMIHPIKVIAQIAGAIEADVNWGEVDKTESSIDVEIGFLAVSCSVLDASDWEEGEEKPVSLVVKATYGDDTVTMKVRHEEALSERQLDALAAMFVDPIPEQVGSEPLRGTLILGGLERQFNVLAHSLRRELMEGPAGGYIEERLAAGHDVAIVGPATVALLDAYSLLDPRGVCPRCSTVH